MGKAFWLSAALLFVVSASAQRPKTSLRKVDGSELTPKFIDTWSEKLLRLGHVKGLGIAIIDADKALVKPYGHRNKSKDVLLDAQTVFPAPGLGIPVLAFLTLKISESGALDLDKPLLEYVSAADRLAASVPNANTQLTARQALTAQDATSLDFLQYALEKTTALSLEQLARTLVFEPLGMPRSSYSWRSDFAENTAVLYADSGQEIPATHLENPKASGTFYTSLSDYARFTQKITLQRGLDARLFPLFFTPTTAGETSATIGFQTTKCGFGRSFYKFDAGNGWAHYVIGFPDKRSAIVLLSNNANANTIFRELTKQLLGEDCTPWEALGFHPYNRKP